MSFRKVKAINSDKNNMVVFREPNPGIANWEGGCGKIVCTQKRNILLSDTDGSFTGEIS